MEAVRTSEMSINFYQTARRNNPEDSHLYVMEQRRHAITSGKGNKNMFSNTMVCIQNGIKVDQKEIVQHETSDKHVVSCPYCLYIYIHTRMVEQNKENVLLLKQYFLNVTIF
jgi:hypothetical protein